MLSTFTHFFFCVLIPLYIIIFFLYQLTVKPPTRWQSVQCVFLSFQITAIFDEEISPYLMHNGGDGTSASSIGTESPDIFLNGDIISTGLSKTSFNGSDVEITDEKISSGIK